MNVRSVAATVAVAVILVLTSVDSAQADEWSPIARRPQSSMSYPGSQPIDVKSLPVCPPPEPQPSNLEQPLPLTDPRAKRCRDSGAGVIAAPGRIASSPGSRAERPLEASPNSGPGDVTASGSVGYTPVHIYFNGNLHGDPQSGIGSVAARLQAMKPILYGPTVVANWIGVQSAGDFFQVGLIYNNVGSAACGTNGNNRPVMFVQAESQNQFLAPYCFNNYIFGVNSHTFFALLINPDGTWTSYVNWAGTWRALITFGPTDISLENSRPSALTEVQVFPGYYADPYVPLIDDNNIQLGDGTGFATLWDENFPTIKVHEGPYCVTYPQVYHNFEVRSGGC
jgi:hypothetical protein